MKRFIILIIASSLFSREALTVEDISEYPVQVLAPTDGAQVPAGTVNFSWSQVDEADSYLIQIATPNFENASQIVLDSLVTQNSVMTNLEANSYQWRVKALNSEYETEFSTVSFTVN